jgi:hypothetical protein
MTDRADEGRHPPGPGRHWEESYSFDFAAPDGSMGGYVRLGLRPGDGVAWYWAAFVSDGTGPHPPLVLVRDHDVPLPRGRTLEVRASGLWADHTCETPLEHWTVGVEAFGVALDDPREAFAGERGDRCPLGLDLEWEASGPPRPARPGDHGGYEQPCTVHGEVLVGSERLEIDCAGWRTHRWGDCDWWSGDPWSWAGGTTDVDVVADGGLVVSATVAGEPASPLAHAPVVIPRPDGGAVSRLDRVLCRFPSGFGWIEHLTPPPPAP